MMRASLWMSTNICLIRKKVAVPMKALLMCLCLCGCAYGQAEPSTRTYGSTKGNTSDQPDSGVDNIDQTDNSLGDGCFINNVIEDGVITNSFVVCPPSQFSVKWLVDPAPEKHHE